MKEGAKLICQNPNHPFKQKWYIWHKGDDGVCCPSCAHHLKMVSTLVEAALEPRITLYGNRLISADYQQIAQLAVAIEAKRGRLETS